MIGRDSGDFCSVSKDIPSVQRQGQFSKCQILVVLRNFWNLPLKNGLISGIIAHAIFSEFIGVSEEGAGFVNNTGILHAV